MREVRSSAIALALDLAHLPPLASVLRQQPLPADVLSVIRIAAGCPDYCAAAEQALGENRAALRDAAQLYLQEMLLHPGSDHYRVLGVQPAAEYIQMREHFRWLIKWLHPDANSESWESILANRVIESWGVLKIPARRAIYDLERVARPALQSGTGVPAPGSRAYPHRAPFSRRPGWVRYRMPEPGMSSVAATTEKRMTRRWLGVLRPLLRRFCSGRKSFAASVGDNPRPWRRSAKP